MTDPHKAFDFVLAQRLKMPVGEMRARMGNREWGEWQSFFRYEQWVREHAEKTS